MEILHKPSSMTWMHEAPVHMWVEQIETASHIPQERVRSFRCTGRQHDLWCITISRNPADSEDTNTTMHVGPFHADDALQQAFDALMLVLMSCNVDVIPPDCDGLPFIGQRVETTAEMERFPMFIVPKGSTGVVVEASPAYCSVRLDNPPDGCAEREIHFSGPCFEEISNLRPLPTEGMVIKGQS